MRIALADFVNVVVLVSRCLITGQRGVWMGIPAASSSAWIVRTTGSSLILPALASDLSPKNYVNKGNVCHTSRPNGLNVHVDDETIMFSSRGIQWKIV